jgi:ABC-type transporter lipoprotein component MlaA
MVGDFLLNPLLWLDVPTYGLGALNVINSRAIADPEIQRARETSLDFYVFLRDAYTQNRAAAVENRSQPSPASTSGPYDDLYDMPDEE